MEADWLVSSNVIKVNVDGSSVPTEISQMVQSKTTSSLLFKSPFDEIHALLNSSVWAFSIHHIYCDVNACTDLLTSHGMEAGLVIKIFSSSFPYLNILIHNDYRGIRASILALSVSCCSPYI
jgi:hypothetical protein